MFIKHIFSHKSDCWAFGVTCWEILTDGLVPYSDLNNKEIVVKITQGNLHLSSPSSCPIGLWEIIVKCFEMDPNSRPSFLQIFHQLCNFQKSLHLRASNSNELVIKELSPRVHKTPILAFLDDYFTYKDNVCKLLFPNEEHRKKFVEQHLAHGIFQYNTSCAKCKGAISNNKIRGIIFYTEPDNTIKKFDFNFLNGLHSSPKEDFKWVFIQVKTSEICEKVVKGRHFVRILQPYPLAWDQEIGSMLFREILKDAAFNQSWVYIGVYSIEQREFLKEQFGFICASTNNILKNITLYSMLKAPFESQKLEVTPSSFFQSSQQPIKSSETDNTTNHYQVTPSLRLTNTENDYEHASQMFNKCGIEDS